MYEKLELLIDGTWRQGSEDKSEPVYNPATGEVLGTLPHASVSDLDEALLASQKGFDVWRSVTAFERQKTLEKEITNTDLRIDRFEELIEQIQIMINLINERLK